MSTDYYAVCHACRAYAMFARRSASVRFFSHGTVGVDDPVAEFISDHIDCETPDGEAALSIETEHRVYEYGKNGLDTFKAVELPEPRHKKGTVR